MDGTPASPEPGGLQRHFGLLHATALNITMVVGAGVFITIPLMLKELPGPYALLGWVAAGLLIIMDGLVWSELAATFPGSGGSYLYLLECYGPNRWGRLMAFLFIWQFLISGPLEVGSGLIAMAEFSNGFSPQFKEMNEEWTRQLTLAGFDLPVFFSPARLFAFLLGVLIIILLYRHITSLGRLTVTIWLGVLGVIAWILLEGALRFDPNTAFDFSGKPDQLPANFGSSLGAAMALAIYSYLGYYNVCYIGDEVRNPAWTIPRAILLTTVLVCVLFAGLHLAMLGTVSWRKIPTEGPALSSYNLPAEFMRQIHGGGAAMLVTALLIWSSFGSAFAALLGYSRIPYGAARRGHFFAVLGGVHPRHRIPDIALLVVGGLTLFWSFFDLQDVINALIVTRILEQFIGQIIGLLLLRRLHPERIRPYRMALYPLPCILALGGWLYVYLTAPGRFIVLGLVTLMAGVAVFFVWGKRTGGWPFGPSVKPPLAA